MLQQGSAAVTPAAREDRAADAARELILYLDGVEGATLAWFSDDHQSEAALDLARRGRHLAREALWLCEQLEAERTGRRAIQEARDRLLEMVAK